MNLNSAEDPRVRLAIERTLLAWIRTGLALMGFGFVVARFGMFLREIATVHDASAPVTPSTGLSLWLGTALILLGVIVNLMASVENIRLIKHVQVQPPYGILSWLMGAALGVVLAVVGIITAVYLVFVAH